MVLLVLQILAAVGSLWFLFMYLRLRTSWRTEVARDIIAFSSLVASVALLSVLYRLTDVRFGSYVSYGVWFFINVAVWNRLYVFYRVRVRAHQASKNGGT